MSYVSAMIVSCWLDEEDTDEDEHSEAINFINAYPGVSSHGTLVPVSQHTTGKHPECLIYIAGYNYLDWEIFIQAVLKAPWKCPERVQILFRDEPEYVFRSFLLTELKGAGE